MTLDGIGVEGEAESFASYLARYLRAERGFHTVVPPEAEALVPACNLVLVCPDPTHHQIACIVDRDAYPDKVFGLPPEAVRAVARACRARTGRFGSGKGPTSVTIYEVGAGAASADAVRRLAGYTREGAFSKAWVRAVAVDPRRGIVAPNAGWPKLSGLGWPRLASAARARPPASALEWTARRRGHARNPDPDIGDHRLAGRHVRRRGRVRHR